MRIVSNLGPNDLLPCGTQSARKRHLARNEHCPRCKVEGRRILPQDAQEWLLRPRDGAA